ncbi:acyl-coenzyme A diphosphatase NUDT19 [Tiliqua scincoides]|uniref:acyl-coenzyme A diphosphatase NUDT19 n=1 Tax=Tiliqua scincoides TaxID=71010 RepID=UPI0034631AC5
MGSRLRPWREAATVVLAAGGGCGPRRGGFDYRLLLLRRSPSSGFLPGAHVFPGGAVDEADFSGEWRALLPGAPGDGGRLPGDVALRICAVREAFEEAGVLLLAEAEAEAEAGAPPAARPARLPPGERLPPAAELAEWRRRVQREPRAFLELCRRLRRAPNVGALLEWARWLTPAARAGRRFDTAFYLCCLGQAPPAASHDRAEVTACQWSTPLEALELFKSQDIWIAPPQFYELCRLCNFPSLHDLHKFGSERALEGCERWMSVVLVASDGHMQLLPGDELYPEDPDFTGEREPMLTTNKKIEDLMKGASRLHRIVIRDLHNVTIHVNIQPKYKHIRPIKMDSKVGNNEDYNSRL